MLKLRFSLFFLLCVLSCLRAQTLPREGSQLTYRMIGFSMPSSAKTGPGKLEIAAGNYSSEDSFKKSIIKTIRFDGNRIIAEVPDFGRQYTWCITRAGAGGKKEKRELHHFATKGTQIDSANTRLRIIKKAEKFSDAYVFCDGTKTLYDMTGKPIWYLPESEAFGKNSLVFDLKPTPDGTITFIVAGRAYEIGYNGDILWREPAGSLGKSHHEFTKLEHNHYMALENEMKICRIATSTDSCLPFFLNDSTKLTPGNSSYMQMPFGALIEYDETGKVVWKWESATYYEGSDLVYFKPPNGGDIIDLHENAFFFDKTNSVIYLSFKNISRVIKIKYPEGFVIGEYGEKYGPAKNPGNYPLFCGQHACKYSSLGCLFLFNNNGCDAGNPPKLKKFKEPASPSGSLEKIWEYDCTVEGNYRKDAPSGGNVIELQDHATFVSMGGEYSKLFIVNDDKKILWSALPEQWFPERNGWFSIVEYRASIVENKKALEKLIWHTQSNRSLAAGPR